MPVFAWIKANTRPSDILACYQDVKYFLLTGRKAVRIDSRVRVPQAERLLEEMIRHVGATYIILTADDFALESRAADAREGMRSYLLAHPDRFEIVLEDERCGTEAYKIRGLSQVRARCDLP